MITLKPFRGVQFTENAGNLSDIVCPPYDMIDEQDVPKWKDKSPHGMIYLELPNTHQDAKDLMDKWLKDEVLKISDEPAYYLYEASYIVNDIPYAMRGTFGAMKLPQDNTSVRVHENTLDAPKDDRMGLLSTANANFSPIFALYKENDKELEVLLEKIYSSSPTSECSQDDVSHKLWKVTDKETLEKLESLMEEKTLYIADGHHRFAVAKAYRDKLKETMDIDESHPANFIFTIVSNASCKGLAVLPTHRLLTDIPEFDSEKSLEEAKAFFNVVPCKSLQATRNKLFEFKRQNKNAFGFFADENFYVLSLKNSEPLNKYSDRKDSYCSLDVAVLHDIFFEKVLLAKPENISFIGSAIKAKSAVDNGDACCAVFLSATRPNEILAVADDGEKMPQKSTCFYPKPITGMVFRSLEV